MSPADTFPPRCNGRAIGSEKSTLPTPHIEGYRAMLTIASHVPTLHGEPVIYFFPRGCSEYRHFGSVGRRTAVVVQWCSITAVLARIVCFEDLNVY